MLHIKYQGPRPCGCRQEDFFSKFPYISLCKTCGPLDGTIFGPGAFLNRLGRGSLGDAKYQKSIV